MSHSVNFKKLRGANFLRFGNEEFVIDFTQGVIGLIGDNGLGKSSILDALAICLFNKSHRPSTQEEWTNNLNGKGLFLSVTLERIENEVDEYVITRKPTARKTSDKLEIYKNGVLMSGIKDLQEYIENTILGFGLNVFKNAIAVSGGTPFISMTPEEKRVFSENLFSIKQVRSYKKSANEKMSDLQLTSRILDQEISSATSKISEYQRMLSITEDNKAEQIAEIDTSIANVDAANEEVNTKIAEEQSHIQRLNNEHVTIRTEVQQLNDKLVEMNANAVYSSLATAKSELDYRIREYKKEMAESVRIAPNVICNHCGNSYSESQAEEHKAIHVANANTIAEAGKVAKARVAQIEAMLPEIEAIRSLIAQNESRRIAVEQEISFRNRTIQTYSGMIYNNGLNRSRMEARKAEIANREDSSSVRAFAEQSIFEAERQIVAKNVDKALADRKISALKYIVEMCSDEGIKKMLLAQFMPILNHLIASYLEKFDLPVKVEFDDKFNHTLTAPKGLGQRHPMMSRGQKTRINLAILFAIAELIRKMGSVRCNLMLLDEFADEGLDAKGFEAAVSSIRRIADRDHRSITLITHKQEDVLFENITKLYEVELKNSFTVLKEVSSY